MCLKKVIAKLSMGTTRMENVNSIARNRAEIYLPQLVISWHSEKGVGFLEGVAPLEFEACTLT